MRTRSPASAPPSFAAKLQHTVRSFSASGRLLFYFFSGVLVVSSCALLYLLNTAFLVEVPTHGGTVTEGIVGAPRFINPVLALSDADHDMTALIFSGLLKSKPDGGYEPDLAESYSVSSDGKTYTFTIRKNAVFQDGKKVSADDVLFTIEKIQDPALKSPQRANWNGIEVQKTDDASVSITLKQAYAPFIENLTIGILPKHLWDSVSDDEFPFSSLNISPIGSGPFSVTTVSRTSSGVPSSYTLSAFSGYTLHTAYLKNIDFRFYQNEESLIDAVKKGEVQAGSGISPANISELSGSTLVTAPLNRVFGAFFNQNQSEALRDADVRKALSISIDRQALIDKVLSGFGTPLEGPLPPSLIQEGTSTILISTSTNDLLTLAKKELSDAGWVPGSDGILQKKSGAGKNTQPLRLSFTLSTGNVPELRAAAEYLRDVWESLGASVEVHIYDQGELAQNIIRPRKYDVLLFGEVIGREPDLFAFWSSSERVDPGLNIAMYTNASTDKILTQLRTTSEETQKNTLYQQFTATISTEYPAAFLYAPDFVYIVPKDIEGLHLGFIETPSDRFLSVTDWHRETDRVWAVFAR